MPSFDFQDLKLRYYDYMIKLDQHEGTYLNICKHYRAVYETPKIKEDPEKKIDTLKLTALYVVLSQYDNEQSDLIHRILADKLLAELPFYKNLLEKFTTMEIINQSATESFEAELKNDKSAVAVFSDTDDGRKRWEDWKLRIVEHNIRIMAKYYRKIKLSRMAELLGLSENAAEEALNTMVISGTVSAKIDRLDGVVDFRREKDPYEVLNEWSTNIADIMALVMQTTHLINKEEMVHKHMQVVAKPAAVTAMDDDE
jgi:26S proteasome regulatory subunit N5